MGRVIKSGIGFTIDGVSFMLSLSAAKIEDRKMRLTVKDLE